MLPHQNKCYLGNFQSFDSDECHYFELDSGNKSGEIPLFSLMWVQISHLVLGFTLEVLSILYALNLVHLLTWTIDKSWVILGEIMELQCDPKEQGLQNYAKSNKKEQSWVRPLVFPDQMETLVGFLVHRNASSILLTLILLSLSLWFVWWDNSVLLMWPPCFSLDSSLGHREKIERVKQG